MQVTLIKPHTHAGREYPPGATITGLRRDQSEWLVALKVAKDPVEEAEDKAPARPPVNKKEQ